MGTYFGYLKDVVSRYCWVPFVAMRGSLYLWSCVVKPLIGDEGSEVGEVFELFIHPIRALRPVKMVGPWNLDKHGFVLDKGMCILEDGERLKHTKPGSEALYDIHVSLVEPYDKLVLSHKDKEDLTIDLSQFNAITKVELCSKGYEYCPVGDGPSTWISEVLGRPVRLMFSPKKTLAGEDMIIQSLDPVLIIGQSSLEAFSADAGWDVEMERFRPNIVSAKQAPYADESWQEIGIGGAVLEFDHRCTRCAITNVIDGVRTSNTMDDLKKIRPRCEKTNKPVFGSYFTVKQTGLVSPGDKIILIKRRQG